MSTIRTGGAFTLSTLVLLILRVQETNALACQTPDSYAEASPHLGSLIEGHQFAEVEVKVEVGVEAIVNNNSSEEANNATAPELQHPEPQVLDGAAFASPFAEVKLTDLQGAQTLKEAEISPSSNASQALDHIISTFINKVDAQRIEDNLRFLTSRPHMAGTPAEKGHADYLRDLWLVQGLDRTEVNSYDVLLSLPGKQRPSRVRILDEAGRVKFTSALQETPFEGEAEYGPDLTPSFSAYSASGEVTADHLVYANYGTFEDFVHLNETLRVDPRGKLILIRYGKVFRGNKVKWAERFGAAGVILYSDPADYHPDLETKDPHPSAWWLPESGVQRGSLLVHDGDPSTPGYPAIDGAYRY